MGVAQAPARIKQRNPEWLSNKAVSVLYQMGRRRAPRFPQTFR